MGVTGNHSPLPQPVSCAREEPGVAGFSSAQSLEMRTEGEGVLGGGRMRLQRDEYEYTVFIYTDYTCMRKANTVSVFDDLDTLQPRFQRISSKTSEVCVCGGVACRGRHRRAPVQQHMPRASVVRGVSVGRKVVKQKSRPGLSLLLGLHA